MEMGSHTLISDDDLFIYLKSNIFLCAHLTTSQYAKIWTLVLKLI